jgi:DNA-binding IclR family transcriptional regulator
VKDQIVNHGAQTAERAIQVLQLIADSSEPLGLTEVARLAGLNKPAANRVLQALTAQGFVGREAGGRRYVIGSGLVALSARVMQGLELRELAAPAMERLAAATSETVSLYVRHQLQRVCIHVVEGRYPVRWVVEVGDTQPLYVGLTGRAILAFLPEADAVVEWGVREGLDRDHLQEHLARVRTARYLTDPGERVAGVNGISAPIFDARGVAAALTISGPGDRFTPAAAEAVAANLVQEAEDVSSALGASENAFLGAINAATAS